MVPGAVAVGSSCVTTGNQVVLMVLRLSTLYMSQGIYYGLVSVAMSPGGTR